MPFTYAHYAFGQEITQRLPAELQLLVRRHLPLYQIGLHGPDILLFYRPFVRCPINQTGYDLHRQAADRFFQRSLSVLQKMSDPEAGLAYLMGFICHFALDSECSNYIEDTVSHSSLTYAEIEGAFDRQLMADYGFPPDARLLTAHLQPRVGDTGIIADFFPDIQAKQIDKALNSMITYHNFLFSSSVKRNALLLLLRITGNYRKMGGLILQTNSYSDCTDSSRELTRRYQGAISSALLLCENFYNTYMEMDVLSRRFAVPFGLPAADKQSSQ